MTLNGTAQPRAAARWLAPLLVAVGALWGAASAGAGLPALAVALAPGGLLLVAGITALMRPDDLRAPRLGAVGALLGTVLALAAFAWLPWLSASALLVSSSLSFLAVGRGVLSTAQANARGLGKSLGAALDETLLAGQPLAEPPLPPTGRAESVAEVRAALALFEARGWLAKPALYHREPPRLDDPEIEPASWGRVRYERMRFASGYEPHAEEPGRARWLGYRANRTAHARLLRQHGEARPWLLCLHGSRAGTESDLRAFGALHAALGVNVVLAVLPLHGPRREGRRSGAGFVGRYEVDFVHAVAQSIWDVRRLLSWMRAQAGGESVGVCGISLGGYTSALLAGLEPDLTCVIAGVPASDFAALDRRAAGRRRLAEAGSRDLAWAEVESLYRVVSPLELPPLLPVERLALFAATADRFLPREQVERLWRHWGEPRLEYGRGGHITALFTESSRKLLLEFLGGFLQSAR